MRKVNFIIVSIILFSLSVSSQTSNEDFYYHQDGKIFLQQKIDKIFVKFASNANREQIRTLINSDASLRPTSDINLNDAFFNFVILEARNGERISSAIIETCKMSSEVVSVTPLFQYNSIIQGLTDEFIVKLKPNTSYTQLQELAKENNCKVGEENQFVKNQFKMSVSKNAQLNALQMSNLFHETGLFEFSQPNFAYINIFNSNDPYFEEQWGLKHIGPSVQYGGDTVDIKIKSAWKITEGNSNIKVALVDQGVEFSHPDLDANLLLPGYDTSGNNSGGAPVWSTDRHGTPCAGIIGAIKDNDEGIAGVAPGCKIIPIHVELYTDQLANAINWAWNDGKADVISNSWGGPSPNASITNAINNAVTQGRKRNGVSLGCVVVFSSGNSADGWLYNTYGVTYPASLSNVIAVGAIDRCGVRAGRIDIFPESCDPWGPNSWPGSCYGIELDVVAPGTNVLTTDRQGNNQGYNTTNTPDYPDWDYTWFGGTSAACPHVAGVAALILSVNPNLYWSEVKNIIESTAQKVRKDLYSYSTAYSYFGRTNGAWCYDLGYGLVDAHAAVKATWATCTTDLSYETINQPQIVEDCVVNVNNVSLGSSANVTITGRYQVEISSLTMTDGAKLFINNGVPVSQTGSSKAAVAVADPELVHIEKVVEEAIEEPFTPVADDTRPRLYQNYPNPFTGATVIPYYLPEGSGKAYLRVAKIDGTAAKIVDIVDTGESEVVLDANAFPSGVYIYSLFVDDQIIDTRRMVVK